MFRSLRYLTITCGATSNDVAAPDDTTLVQNFLREVHAPAPAPAFNKAARESLKGLPDKVIFMHVPKSGGTSFLRGVVLSNQLCSFQTKEEIADFINDFDRDHNHNVVEFLEFKHRFSGVLERSCKGLNAKHFTPAIHGGIGNYYKHDKGHLLTMLRQPEQRIISGYHHGQHDFTGKEVSLPEYAEHVGGCAVRMLTRSGFPCGSKEGTMPSDEDVALAQQRLKEGFAFVGLVEKWDLSVCLLHTMFGGECLAEEFENLRPGQDRNSSLYDVAPLEGYVDKYDGALYQTASEIFESNLKTYDVSEATCAKCYEKRAEVTFDGSASTVPILGSDVAFFTND